MSGFSGVPLTSGSYTPSVSSGTGTFTGHTLTVNNAKWVKEGDVAVVDIDITLTALGSGNPGGNLSISTPFTPNHRGCIMGFEQALTGSLLRGTFAPVPEVVVVFQTGATVIAAGNRIVISGLRFRV
jgi:hypothetical protein